MDTRDKRASAITVGSPWRLTLPVADGALDQGDRQHVAYFYRGILAGAAVADQPAGVCIAGQYLTNISITGQYLTNIDIAGVYPQCED